MELISYASDFVSFYIQNSKNINSVKQIILFGSVARGEATKKSDIDIFIDAVGDDKTIEKEAKKILSDFYDSVKYKNYWKLLNIKNDFSIIVGKINEWKLKDSMLGSAFVLYSHYSPKLEGGKNKAIVFWEPLTDNSQRVMLNKKLFGFKHYGREYSGMIEKLGGKKLGANVVIIDIENLKPFLEALRNAKAVVRTIRVFEYEE